MKTLTSDATMAQIISGFPIAVQLFRALGMNPDLQKEKTLRSICRHQKWSEVEVLQWLKKSCLAENEKSNDEKDISSWREYLEREMRKSMDLLSEVNEAFPRVHQIHGNQYPWLKNMRRPFEQYAKILKESYTFKEKELYPLAKELDKEEEKAEDQQAQNPEHFTGKLENDQKKLQSLMNEIREKGQNFRNPAGACSTFRILNQNFRMLFKNLEDQLKVDKRIILPVINQKTL